MCAQQSHLTPVVGEIKIPVQENSPYGENIRGQRAGGNIYLYIGNSANTNQEKYDESDLPTHSDRVHRVYRIGLCRGSKHLPEDGRSGVPAELQPGSHDQVSQKRLLRALQSVLLTSLPIGRNSIPVALCRSIERHIILVADDAGAAIQE
ncbi:hypothetical protein TNCV_812391 [Trichonephila clavipes]|nr:hypothetical protein TNCV_812391 [Trichonephila clavipes]